MQRTALLISISLAAVLLGLFFIDARVNPPTRNPSSSTLISVQTSLPHSDLEPETDAGPSTRENPVTGNNAQSPIDISVASASQTNTDSLLNTDVPGNVQSAASAQRNGKTFDQPDPNGNLAQESSGEEPKELPPIVVPLDLNNPSSPATLPAVLVEALPSENFTPQQLAGINKLTEDFIKAVTDPTIPQDPKNPVYQQRWRSAQVTADDLFRIHYGDYAWMQRHNAAHREILLKGGK